MCTTTRPRTLSPIWDFVQMLPVPFCCSGLSHCSPNLSSLFTLQIIIMIYINIVVAVTQVYVTFTTKFCSKLFYLVRFFVFYACFSGSFGVYSAKA